ncbi:tetratricopeptide repeat protein [Actinoplanes sp. GCM10030250]|uniref:tetratricopeptide repeat protein n=1 Tax=Actinoplanes sp. GCM10030250 TaxID=3273376 RepID=UPI00361A0008
MSRCYTVVVAVRNEAVTIMDLGDSFQADVSNSRNIQIGSDNTLNSVEVDAGTLPPPQRAGGRGGVPHNLPPASAVFEGRDVADLAALLNGADGGVVVGQAAVHGLGGIGKSELANQYARSYMSGYRLVWWITADNRSAVGLGLAALTERLHPVATLAANAQEWARGWLQSNTDWLLVLDNVEDINDIADLLGLVSGRGHVLVTTRRDLRARWRGLGFRTLQLEVLDRTSSIRLLRELTDLDDAAGAGRLAERLGDLPLGLQQAAAYVSQHDGMTFDHYTALLTEEFGRAAGNAGVGDTGQRTMAAVWTVTMRSVAESSAVAATVLDVMAWLGADPLPESVLYPLAHEPRDVDDALAILASYSMIKRRSRALTVHRLVQAVTRNQNVVDERATAVRGSAVQLLVKAAPEDPIANVAGFPMWAALIPHVQALVEQLPADHESTAMLFVLDRAASYQQHQGNFDAATALFEQALADSERILGSGNELTLAVRANLGGCYREVGRVGLSITIFEEVTADCERISGPDHAHTLTARANLAASYWRAGRTDEALTIQEQLVADSDRALGTEHPTTLNAYANLANLFREVGRTNDTIPIYERVLAIREQILGPDHPNTLTARGNLAASYRQASRTVEAITIEESVAADLERVLGPDHPHALTARGNLASSYQSAGRTAEAISIFERLAADIERVLGPEHPHTLTLRNNLAVTYWDAGRSTEAIAIEERVVTGRRRTLGAEHPQTIAAANLLMRWNAAGSV